MKARLSPLQKQSVAHEAFLQALILEDQGQAQYALEALLSTLYYDDSDRWLLLRTAQRMRDLRRSADAIPLVKKALAMPGAGAEDWELLAGLWLDGNRTDSARMALSKALEIDPDSRHALVGVAVLAEKEGRPLDAASGFARLALVSENPEPFAQKAYQIWGRAGRRDSILSLSRGLWARNRGLRDGLIASELLARQKDPSWKALLDSLEPDDDSLRLPLHRIRCSWMAGEADSTRELVHLYLRTTDAGADLPLIGAVQFEDDSGQVLESMLLSLHGSDPSWRIPLTLGTLHLSRGRKDSAATWLDLALYRDSTRTISWLRRCALEVGTDSSQRLVQLSRAFVRHCPREPQARWLLVQGLGRLAEARLHSKPWESVPADSEPEATLLRLEALAHLQTLETLDTARGSVSFEKAALLERLGRFRESDSLLRGIIAKDSTNHIAMNYLGYVLADRNQNLDEAAFLIGRALQLAPDNGAYLDSRAWLEFRQGRYEAALKSVNAAMEAHRNDEVILEHRARILEALGRTQDALRDWTLLSERVPDYRNAQDALQRLSPAPRSPLP